jgi:tetratricopeptide (TPR) repeat protein
MPRKDFWRVFVVCMVIGLGTVALYSPAFMYHFVNLDDVVYVTSNGHVNHGVTADAIKWAFTSPYAGNWHPVTWISHMVDCQVFGPNPTGHHVVNVVLHALASVVLFLALRCMTGALWRSAAVAAFFAWHPLHVESVAWIAERKDVLSGLFFMLTLWAYVRYAQTSKWRPPGSKFLYVLSLIFFAIGLMAKPMLVTLPFILIFLDWWPLGRLGAKPAPAIAPAAAPLSAAALPADALAPVSPPAPAPEAETKTPATPSWRCVLAEKIPFFLLSIASCIVTVMAWRHQGVNELLAILPFRKRLVTAGASYFHYIEKLVWPSDLGPTYPFIIRWPKWEMAAVALLLLGITVIAIQIRKTRPYWLVGWLWFVVMLAPTLNLPFPAAQSLADRYMYLPSIGLLILVCWEVSDIAEQWPACGIIAGVLCVAALAGCCLVTSSQLHIWRDESTLVSRIPQPESNFAGHADYAAYLLNHNQIRAAETESEQAVAILPGYAPFQSMLAEIFFLERRYDDCIQKCHLVSVQDPDMVGIHLLWGRALIAEKKPEAAAAEFKTVITAQPRNFEAYNMLGATDAGALGKTSAAIDEFRRSISLQPKQPEILNNLAWILATDPDPKNRNGDDAVKFAAQACALTHSSEPLLLGTLAAAYAEAGRFDDAIATAQSAHDVAMAQAAAAEKAKQPAAASNRKALAARETDLVKQFQAHKPFRRKTDLPAAPK